MAQDEYELLPHAELEHLRREVERLKRNPLGDTQASISLLESINSLNDNIQRLVKIFQSANDDMARMARDGSVQEQMRRLREENAKIAHGIVALSEMIDGNSLPSAPPQPETQSFEPSQNPEPPSMPPQEPQHDPAYEQPDTSHDDVLQQMPENPFMEEVDENKEPDIPLSEPGDADQFTGEPLPPPPRR